MTAVRPGLLRPAPAPSPRVIVGRLGLFVKRTKFQPKAFFNSDIVTLYQDKTLSDEYGEGTCSEMFTSTIPCILELHGIFFKLTSEESDSER